MFAARTALLKLLVSAAYEASTRGAQRLFVARKVQMSSVSGCGADGPTEAAGSPNSLGRKLCDVAEHAVLLHRGYFEPAQRHVSVEGFDECSIAALRFDAEQRGFFGYLASK